MASGGCPVQPRTQAVAGTPSQRSNDDVMTSTY